MSPRPAASAYGSTTHPSHICTRTSAPTLRKSRCLSTFSAVHRGALPFMVPRNSTNRVLLDLLKRFDDVLLWWLSVHSHVASFIASWTMTIGPRLWSCVAGSRLRFTKSPPIHD